MTYLVLKLIHVGAVLMFLGNITTGIFWKEHADRTRDPRIMANTMEGIIRSDRLFTVPGVLLIVLAGVAAALRAHYPLLRTGWIFWSIVLFIVSGAAFGSQVAPLQRKLLAAAREGVGNPEGAAEWRQRYELLSRRWAFWGGVALVAPLLAMALMVLKPSIPGIL